VTFASIQAIGHIVDNLGFYISSSPVHEPGMATACVWMQA